MAAQPLIVKWRRLTYAVEIKSDEFVVGKGEEQN
jgi:hypothetical protein